MTEENNTTYNNNEYAKKWAGVLSVISTIASGVSILGGNGLGNILGGNTNNYVSKETFDLKY